MKKKKLIPLSLIVIVALAILCITLIVLHQGGSSPAPTEPDQTPGTSDVGSEDEIDFGDLLNPDADSSMGDDSNAADAPSETEGDDAPDLNLPDAMEGGNDGYSNGWY